MPGRCSQQGSGRSAHRLQPHLPPAHDPPRDPQPVEACHSGQALAGPSAAVCIIASKGFFCLEVLLYRRRPFLKSNDIGDLDVWVCSVSCLGSKFVLYAVACHCIVFVVTISCYVLSTGQAMQGRSCQRVTLHCKLLELPLFACDWVQGGSPQLPISPSGTWSCDSRRRLLDLGTACMQCGST